MHAPDPTIVPSSGPYTAPLAPAVNAVIAGPLGSLPEEVLLLLFSNLDSIKDVTALGLGCRKLHQLSLDEAGIWRPLYRTLFPNANSSDGPTEPNGYLELYKGFAALRHNIKAGAFTQRLLQGHEGRIECTQAVGDLLYTGSEDKTVKVWNMTTGECLRTFKGHEDEILCLQVVENLLYTGSRDKTVKVWDTATGECLRTFSGHEDWVTLLEVVEDRLYTGSRDKTVKIWDTATGECPQTFSGHKDWPVFLKVVGNHICTSGFDFATKIWDKATGECLQTIQVHRGIINESLKVVENRFFMFSNGNAIELRAIPTGECLQTFNGHEDVVTAQQVVGNRLYSGSQDGAIKVWDISTGECLQTFQCHITDVIKSLEVVGNCLFTVSNDKTLKVTDTTTGACLRVFEVDPYELNSVVGNRLITVSRDHMITIRDFGFPCLSSYPLQLLKENLAILGKIAGHQQEQNVETAMNLAEELHPDFKQRLDEYCPEGGTSSTVSKEAILHVQAVVYAEVLLHAIHDENWEGVHEILDQLQSIDLRHTAKLCELLEIECGKDSVPQWGEQAFRDTLGYSAPIHSKLEAVRKFREALKSGALALPENLSGLPNEDF